MVQVIKRDGRTVEEFNKDKIVCAIEKAMNRTDVGIDTELASRIAESISNAKKKTLHIEEIQETVEDKLMSSSRKDVAKEYIRYRYKRQEERNAEINLDTEIQGLFDLTSEEVRNNANKAGDKLQSYKAMVSDITSKDYAMRRLIPERFKKEHEKSIYWHDLNYEPYPIWNCIEENGWIHYKDENGVKMIQLKKLKNMFKMKDTEMKVLNKKAYVMGRNGWTRLQAISVRPTIDGEDVLTFKTRTGLPLKATGEHRIPVLREGKEIIVEAKEIKVGDVFLSTRELNVDLESSSDNFLNLLDLDGKGDLDLRIINTARFSDYLKYKYGVTLNEMGIQKNKGMSVKEFKEIHKRYSVPFDILLELRIKAHGSKTSTPIIIPYTNSLAKLYGYMYADGGVYINEERSAYQLTFTNTNEQLIDDFIDCFEDVFDIRLTKNYPSGWSTSPCIRTTCGSRLLVSLFKDFAGAKKINSADMSIPDFIMGGSDDIKLAFLSACYDSDGYLGDQQMGYTTNSDKYAEQFTMILQSLGYNPTKVLSHKKGSVYRFGKKSGVRNYDGYIVKLSRADEINELYNRMDTYKVNESYEPKGFNKRFVESEVVHIYKNETKTFVYDLQTESQWFVVNDYVVHNCTLINWMDMLDNGCNINGVDIETPKSIETAVALLSQIVAHVSSNCFGGVTLGELSHLSIYGKKSLDKHRQIGIDEGVKDIEGYAWRRLKKEIYNACQSLEYEIQTLTNSRAEVPFLTVELDACDNYIDEEDRLIKKMIISSYLDVRIGGLTGGKTAVFPKLVFQLKKGVNLNPEDPNYDLFKKAILCSSRRLYPDFLNYDKLVEVTGGYKPPINLVA